MTTPAEKDAMALAAMRDISEFLNDIEFDGSAERLAEARAHLAARLAELTQQLEASIAMTGEQLRRADRAEAELAAVRATANAFSMTVAAAMKEGAICKEHRATERMIDAGLELNRIVLKSYADAARGAK